MSSQAFTRLAAQGLVARLAALVDAGQISPSDAVQYANYPDRLLSQQERAELRTIAADMTRLEPKGRSDGVEYVPQALNNAEYEAQFAAGLVRKGSLGFATESDMNQNWEGAYFSIYHPAELNPQLRLFANQLNSNVSLVRPTTQRNLSKPMFLTPGIERDPMAARVNMQLNQITSQQASLSQQIAQQRQELARLNNLGQASQSTKASVMNQIKQLEAQIASLDMTRRQLYGTDQAYQENSGEPAPLVDAPPAQADILGLDDFNNDVAAQGAPDPVQTVQPMESKLLSDVGDTKTLTRAQLAEERARRFDARAARSAALIGGLMFSGAAASAGAAGSGNATGPGGVRNDIPVPDNGQGGASAGNDAGAQARPVVNPPATYGYGAALGDLANGVYGALQGLPGAVGNAIDAASIATMG